MCASILMVWCEPLVTWFSGYISQDIIRAGVVHVCACVPSLVPMWSCLFCANRVECIHRSHNHVFFCVILVCVRSFALVLRLTVASAVLNYWFKCYLMTSTLHPCIAFAV